MELDIEGNQRAVEDARGRTIMRYGYDMLGRRTYQDSNDAGKRWTLPDIAGKPVLTWDSRGHEVHHGYDGLRRPTGLSVKTTGGTARLAEDVVYGEGQPNDKANNLRGKSYQLRDGAGIFTNDRYDFKGNLLASTRRLLTNYRDEVDWSLSPPTDPNEVFSASTAYDALDRPTSDRAGRQPDRTIV